ncbi:MAG: thioredoxin family protein [Bacteroidia bacterium]
MKTLILATVFAFSSLSLKFISNQSGYKVGDKVEDFKLKNIDGKMLSMADYKEAKGIIVIFTCNHCPFSVAYEDRIIDIHKRYAPKGYPVIAINPNDATIQPDDSFDKMKERAKKKKFPFAYLYDETQEVAKRFGATRTPHVFVVSKKDTEFIVDYIGAIDDNSNEPQNVKTKYLENALNELLEGKPVSQNFTKAIGCTIKWKKE